MRTIILVGLIALCSCAGPRIASQRFQAAPASRQVAANTPSDVTVEDLIQMRIHGVTSEFAREVRQMYPSVSIHQLVNMRIHGVTTDFAREARQTYPSISIRELVNMRIHGVTLDFIREMRQK
jgi:hypothetical protein